MVYMREKGGNKGCSIRKYFKYDIVYDEFEAKANKFVKYHWPRALTREERLGILMLNFYLRKEHVHRCIKMVSSLKSPASNVLTTVACIFCQKRDILKSVWAEYMKKKRVTVKALP